MVQRESPQFGGMASCTSLENIQAEQAVCRIPQDVAITAVDARRHTLIGALADGRGEITGLALWLLAERANSASEAGPLVRALPERTLTPILWDDAMRKNELRGSPVLEEARSREAELREEWASLADAIAAAPNSSDFDADAFCATRFLEAVSVVLAHAIYLPAAQCFALLPFVSFMRRTGTGAACNVDYDEEAAEVVVTAVQPLAAGSEVLLNDARPNNERLLATGFITRKNPANYLLYETELVQTDKLYTAKREVLQAMGLKDKEVFPLYIDRFPIQLLAFLRLARIQDVAQLASSTFERDVVVSQLNEYEVLQLVMGDLRERLQEYLDNQEEDGKLLQRDDISREERLAVLQRVSEKDILLATNDAIRMRLAPIRGVPTKGGRMEDPNQDLLEIFESVENIGNAPQRIWSSFSRWASGKDDPDFKR